MNFLQCALNLFPADELEEIWLWRPIKPVGNLGWEEEGGEWVWAWGHVHAIPEVWTRLYPFQSLLPTLDVNIQGCQKPLPINKEKKTQENQEIVSWKFLQQYLCRETCRRYVFTMTLDPWYIFYINTWISCKSHWFPQDTHKCTTVSQLYRKWYTCGLQYSQLNRNPCSHLIASASHIFLCPNTNDIMNVDSHGKDHSTSEMACTRWVLEYIWWATPFVTWIPVSAKQTAGSAMNLESKHHRGMYLYGWYVSILERIATTPQFVALAVDRYGPQSCARLGDHRVGEFSSKSMKYGLRLFNYINREQGVVFQWHWDLKVLWNLLLLSPKSTINLINVGLRWRAFDIWFLGANDSVDER